MQHRHILIQKRRIKRRNKRTENEKKDLKRIQSGKIVGRRRQRHRDKKSVRKNRNCKKHEKKKKKNKPVRRHDHKKRQK